VVFPVVIDVIAGWKSHQTPAHDQSAVAHLNWTVSGIPLSGYLVSNEVVAVVFDSWRVSTITMARTPLSSRPLDLLYFVFFLVSLFTSRTKIVR